MAEVKYAVTECKEENKIESASIYPEGGTQSFYEVKPSLLVDAVFAQMHWFTLTFKDSALETKFCTYYSLRNLRVAKYCSALLSVFMALLALYIVSVGWYDSPLLPMFIFCTMVSLFAFMLLRRKKGAKYVSAILLSIATVLVLLISFMMSFTRANMYQYADIHVKKCMSGLNSTWMQTQSCSELSGLDFFKELPNQVRRYKLNLSWNMQIVLYLAMITMRLRFVHALLPLMVSLLLHGAAEVIIRHEYHVLLAIFEILVGMSPFITLVAFSIRHSEKQARSNFVMKLEQTDKINDMQHELDRISSRKTSGVQVTHFTPDERDIIDAAFDCEENEDASSLRSWELEEDSISSVGRQLGRGSFGVVREALLDGRKVAIKQVHTHPLTYLLNYILTN